MIIHASKVLYGNTSFLPECAPAEWQDRAKLWNAVEEAEKTKDSRLTREFDVALPIELGKAHETGLIGVANDAGVQRAKDRLEENLIARHAEQTVQARSKINLGLAAQVFHDLEVQAAEFDPDELMDASLVLRPKEESRATSILKENYTWYHVADMIKQAKADVDKLLYEEPAVAKPRSLRENLRQKQKKVQQRELPKRKKSKRGEVNISQHHLRITFCCLKSG